METRDAAQEEEDRLEDRLHRIRVEAEVVTEVDGAQEARPDEVQETDLDRQEEARRAHQADQVDQVDQEVDHQVDQEEVRGGRREARMGHRGSTA